jgi:hypothetical protein
MKIMSTISKAESLVPLSRKEQLAATKAEIYGYYHDFWEHKLRGKDWVDDELFFRDLRDAMDQIPKHGIKRPPGMSDAEERSLWRGVQSGPCWQLRPYQKDQTASQTSIRISKGRTFKSALSAAAQGKTFSPLVVFFVVGAVVSQGNGKTVRVEGAVDLENTKIHAGEVRNLKMGIWKDAIIDRGGRHYVRAVMFLFQPNLALASERNTVINTGWEAKKLLVSCAAPKSPSGFAWLKVLGPIPPVGNEIVGYQEISTAVHLKTQRAIQQREDFFAGLRSQLELPVQAGQNCNRFTETVLALKKVLGALTATQICDAIRSMSPFIPDGKTAKADFLARKKYYEAKLTALFRLNREVATANNSLAAVIGMVPPKEVPSPGSAFPTDGEAADAANSESEDIEAGTEPRE